MHVLVGKLLSMIMGRDPYTVVAELKKYRGEIMVEEGFRGLNEVEWIAKAARWSLVKMPARSRIPCMWVKGVENLKLCGSIGEVVAHAIPYVMRTAVGWKPRSCSGLEVDSASDPVIVYFVDGLPCAVALASSAELVACNRGLQIVFINAYDYAKAYGRLPVKSVPSVEYRGRIAPIPAPHTGKEIAKTIRRLISHG